MLQVSEIIGVTGIFVDSKEDAVAFYERFGFERAETDPLKLWLPMTTIAKLLGEQ